MDFTNQMLDEVPTTFWKCKWLFTNDMLDPDYQPNAGKNRGFLAIGWKRLTRFLPTTFWKLFGVAAYGADDVVFVKN